MKLTSSEDGMPGDVMTDTNTPVVIVLSGKEFDSYKAAGYFDGVEYSRNFRDGNYEVIIKPESYMRFYNNKSEKFGQ